MTRTAKQTTYFKSVATESKLLHVPDGVYGRCTRTSSRIISQHTSAAADPHPGTITNVRRTNKFNYILFACFPGVKMNIVKRDTYHKNRVIKQQGKLKHSSQHSANGNQL